jgi:lysophospholipase L1-like esterase
VKPSTRYVSGCCSLRWIFAAIACINFAAVHATTGLNMREYDLYPGDFNGDGEVDTLYVAKDPAQASGIVLSDGNGSNTRWQSWASNYLGIPWSGNQFTVIIADLNGDHRADIFLQRNTRGDSYLLLANGEGKILTISQMIPGSYEGLYWTADQHKIIAGDFTGDGRAELFLQATSPSGLNAVIAADINGQLISAPLQSWNDGYLGFNWSTQEANVLAGDFNGNGVVDLLIQAKPKITMIDYDIPFPASIYPPNSNGVALSSGGNLPFQKYGVQHWNRNEHGADWSPLLTSANVGDFNGDGCADVFLRANLSFHKSYLLYGKSSGAIFGSASSATFLGDSITFFWNIASNAGVSGETTHDMLDRLDRDVLSQHPALVHILAGTNDMSPDQSSPDRSPTDQPLMTSLMKILDRVAASGATVIIGTIPPRGAEYTSHVQAWNAKIRSIASRRGYILADYYPALINVDGSQNSDFFPDGTHPNAAGYKKMCEVLRKVTPKPWGPFCSM